MKRQDYLFLVVVLLVAIFIIWWGRSYGRPVEIIKKEVSGPLRLHGVGEPEIGAETALLGYIDPSGSTTLLYSRAHTIERPIASITKLLTAYTALELGFPSSDPLLLPMLIVSDNASAYAVAEHAAPMGDFVAKANDVRTNLGMYHTFLYDPSGLDGEDTGTETNYSTAYDLFLLARAILTYHPEIFAITRRIDSPYFNTNQLLSELWPTAIVGGKTGTTDQAEQALLFVLEGPKEGSFLVSVVLRSQDRFTDTRSLMAWAFRAYQFQ